MDFQSQITPRQLCVILAGVALFVVLMVGFVGAMAWQENAAHARMKALLTSHLAEDFDGDGVTDFVYALSNTYDSKGNLLTSRFAYDFNNDGADDYSDTSAYTYDSKGNVSSVTETVDSNGDGVTDSRFTAHYAY